MTKPNDPVVPAAVLAMIQPKDGPATGVYEPCLTKREYFAAMAMQGLCTIADFSFEKNTNEDVGRRAVAIADAIIAELNKEVTK
jgi:hypothetical protein